MQICYFFCYLNWTKSKLETKDFDLKVKPTTDSNPWSHITSNHILYYIFYIIFMPTNDNYTSRYLNLYWGRLLPSFIRPNPTTELAYTHD